MCNAILLISCVDKKGIIAEVTNLIYENGGNIEHSDQHIDDQTNTFFMRIEWSLKGFKLDKNKIPIAFKFLADEFKMNWNLHFSNRIPRVAIFVSKHLHCLHDLLLRYKVGQFKCEIPLIISNHHDAKDMVDFFNIRFLVFPINKDNKQAQEQKETDILKEEKIDLIVLARYMQILSKDFVNDFPNQLEQR